MLNVYTAFTKEIDDPEVAAAEILAQLKLNERRLKNSVGLVQFYHEFIDTGAYEAVAKALPFELVGCATLFNGTRADHDEVALSVTMLTSDDATFTVKTITGVADKTREQIDEDVVRIGKELCEIGVPKVVFSYIASVRHYSGDDLVCAVDNLKHPFPLFGTMAFADAGRPELNYVARGGEIAPDMSAFVAVHGNVSPEFRVTTVFDYTDEIIKYSEVTDADGCVLKSVDGMTAVEYFKRNGMVNDDSSTTSTMWVVPAICVKPDGFNVARAFLGMDPESGCAFAAGHIHKGSKVSFTTLSSEKILESARGFFKEIAAAPRNDVVALSCDARLWALGTGFGGEAEAIAEVVAEHEKASGVALNYCLSYSGGELCPVKNENGEYVNVYHNYTLIACSFN